MIPSFRNKLSPTHYTTIFPISNFHNLRKHKIITPNFFSCKTHTHKLIFPLIYFIFSKHNKKNQNNGLCFRERNATEGKKSEIFCYMFFYSIIPCPQLHVFSATKHRNIRERERELPWQDWRRRRGAFWCWRLGCGSSC